jgi:hypothetical protein
MNSIIRAIGLGLLVALTLGSGLAAAEDGMSQRTSLAESRDVECSQPGMIYAYKIPADSAEVANDCWPSEAGRVVRTIWWGGYTDWDAGWPHIVTFDVRFYTDVECFPDVLIAEYIAATPDTFSMGNCTDGLPCYRYELEVDVPVASERFWFSVMVAQGVGDRYPPKWGRLGDEMDDGCPTVWRFGADDPWDVPQIPPDSDASQEFWIEPVTPVEGSTWGAIKEIFR